jgi:uncharacterized protein (DUF1015 family)
MAQLFPFRAYRYNPAKTDPARVLTQPYDKITPEMQKRYAAASPYNLVAIEKGLQQMDDWPEDNVYTRAARSLEDWITAKILVQDPAPAFYAYFQEFEVPGTTQRQIRKGFIALCHLEDYSAGVVFRHEQTLTGPKADRLELMRHTRVNTGQLFMLYEDPARRMDAILDRATAAPPTMDMRDEFGVVHYIWRLDQPEIIAAIQSEMAAKKLVIADGHHRYETALAYRDEQRAKHAASNSGPLDPNAPYEKVMMTLVNSHSSGLTILPTHRVVAGLPKFNFLMLLKRLSEFFDVRDVPLEGPASRRAATVRDQLVWASASGGRAIGAYAGGDNFALLVLRPNANLEQVLPNASPKQRELDVVLLHDYILDKGLGITAESVRQETNTKYEREAAIAMSTVAEGRAQICFLLNPVRVEQVMQMALAGEVLPQKSTDFYPKMLSGVTIYRLEE